MEAIKTNYLANIKLDSVVEAILKHKVAVLATSSVLLYSAYFMHRPRKLPPGPIGLPYIGSMRELTGDISKDFSRIGKKYGEIFCLWMGADRYVVVLNSYDVVKEAKVTRGADFAERIPGHTLGDFNVTEPLFNASYDEAHKYVRKLTIGTFRKFVTSKMESILSTELDKFGETIASWKGNAFGVYKDMECIIANMFSSLHFDKTFPHNHPEVQKVVTGVDDWYDAFEDAFRECFTGRRPKPVDGIKHLNNYRSFIQQHIREHVETLDPNNTRDMIDALLKDGVRDKFGEETMANMIMELIPNGVITGAIALSWMFNYLLLNPSYQDALLEEITNLRGTSTVRLEDRPNLPLVEAFLMETMRLSTPLQISMVNKPVADTTLRGYYIPGNALIVANLAGIHLDPKYFPDPHTFKPERFIKDGKIDSREGYIPFGMGRRICVGEYLIRSALFYIFANIVQRYKLSSPDFTEMARDVSNNLMLKGGNIQVHFEERK